MAVFEKRRSQSGELRYRVKVRIRGYPLQSKTFKRLSDAKRWAQKVETEIHEGLNFPNTRKNSRTLSEVIDRYLEETLPKKSKAMQEIQAPQLRWWKRQLGSYFANEITPAVIIEHRSKLERGKRQGGVSRSPSTCNRYVAARRHVFSIAVRDWDWLPDNPAARVVKLREPPGRIRCLDTEERQVLLEECSKSKSPYLHLVVLIALSTGMRLNEIRGLNWKQINFSDEVVLLFKTKNGRARRVPIQGEALRELKKHAKVRRLGTDLVFPSSSNPKNPADIRDAWDYAVSRAGLKDFRFHDLRHTAASYYAMSGATARDLGDIFGWQTIQMAMRYAHLFDSHTSELAARMNAKFLDGDIEENHGSVESRPSR